MVWKKGKDKDLRQRREGAKERKRAQVQSSIALLRPYDGVRRFWRRSS